MSCGNPSGLDKQYAQKISLVYNPQNATFHLYYCACGNQGRGIGLITSKPLSVRDETQAIPFRHRRRRGRVARYIAPSITGGPTDG